MKSFTTFKEEMNMTKKLLSGILAGLFIFSAFASTTAFADEVNSDVKSEIRNPFAGEKKERTPEQRAEFRLELVETYAPDQVDNYNALVEKHQSIHASIDLVKEELKGLHTAQKEVIKEAFKTYVDDLKTQIEAGDITREDAAELFDTFAEDMKADREIYKPDQEIMDSIKADLEANKTERAAVRSDLKVAIDEENTDEAYDLILQLLELGSEHNEMDEEKLVLLQDLLTNLAE